MIDKEKQRASWRRSNVRTMRLLGAGNAGARQKLDRMLLFDYVGRCNMLYCYQCGEPIEVIEEFSVEHKEPWRIADDPVASFFDLDNVAFSHRRCNTGAANRRKYATKAERNKAAYKRKSEYMKAHPEKRRAKEARKRANRRERYATDPEYRARMLEQGKVQRKKYYEKHKDRLAAERKEKRAEDADLLRELSELLPISSS